MPRRQRADGIDLGDRIGLLHKASQQRVRAVRRRAASARFEFQDDALPGAVAGDAEGIAGNLVLLQIERIIGAEPLPQIAFEALAQHFPDRAVGVRSQRQLERCCQIFAALQHDEVGFADQHQSAVRLDRSGNADRLLGAIGQRVGRLSRQFIRFALPDIRRPVRTRQTPCGHVHHRLDIKPRALEALQYP